MTHARVKNKKIFPKQIDGFTIVELLIVIIVIAVLAVVTVIAFNGLRERANFSKAQSDLKSITKALALYKIDNGAYPITDDQDGCEYDWCGWEQAKGDDFIVGLSPKYISKIPQMPDENVRADTYLYQSNGTDYQLIRYKPGGLPTVETQNNPLLATTDGYGPNGVHGGLAWGYKTNSGGWW
jgi:type II secretion system protein G